MRKFTQKPLFLIIPILLFIILAELILIGAKYKSPIVPSQLSLQKYADEVIRTCVNEKEGERQTCYDIEIPKLMDYISMEDTFKVTFLVQEQDQNYRYCHVLGHKLSAREIDKDPSKWKDVVSRCPSGMCSNGCIHGGFQERFRAESFTDEQLEAVKPDLDTLCEKRSNWNPTGLEQASCYHALGHLTMYLTAADIDKSVKLCEEVAIKKDGRDLSHLCFDGSFMQIFQPLEPEDFALIKGKEVNKDQVNSFCEKYSGAKRGSCISESWPLFRQELISDPKKLVWFCSREEPEEQDRCYAALFYVLTAQFQFDEAKIKSYCSGLPNEKQGLCFANAASRMIETDYRNISKSVTLCESAPLSTQSACFDELLKYSTYNFHAGSSEFFKLCEDLPDPWKSKCLEKSPGERSYREQ